MKRFALTALFLTLALTSFQAAAQERATVIGTGYSTEPFSGYDRLDARGVAMKRAKQQAFQKACAATLRSPLVDWSSELSECVEAKLLPIMDEFVESKWQLLQDEAKVNPDAAASKDSLFFAGVRAQFKQKELRYALTQNGCFRLRTPLPGGSRVAVYVREWSQDNTVLLGTVAEIAVQKTLRNSGFKFVELDQILPGKSKAVFEKVYLNQWRVTRWDGSAWITPWGGGVEGGVTQIDFADTWNEASRVLDATKVDLIVTGRAVANPTTQANGARSASCILQVIRLKDRVILAEASATGVGLGGDSEMNTQKALEKAGASAAQDLLYQLDDAASEKE